MVEASKTLKHFQGVSPVSAGFIEQPIETSGLLLFLKASVSEVFKKRLKDRAMGKEKLI